MYGKSFEMMHFRVFRTRRSQSWTLPGPVEAVGMKKMRNTAPMGAVGRESKMEILVYTIVRRSRFALVKRCYSIEKEEQVHGRTRNERRIGGYTTP